VRLGGRQATISSELIGRGPEPFFQGIRCEIFLRWGYPLHLACAPQIVIAGCIPLGAMLCGIFRFKVS
jgi:hypothetical protein